MRRSSSVFSFVGLIINGPFRITFFFLYSSFTLIYCVCVCWYDFEDREEIVWERDRLCRLVFVLCADCKILHNVFLFYFRSSNAELLFHIWRFSDMLGERAREREKMGVYSTRVRGLLQLWFFTEKKTLSESFFVTSIYHFNLFDNIHTSKSNERGERKASVLKEQ